jgi:hypothetical protein
MLKCDLLFILQMNVMLLAAPSAFTRLKEGTAVTLEIFCPVPPSFNLTL